MSLQRFMDSSLVQIVSWYHTGEIKPEIPQGSCRKQLLLGLLARMIDAGWQERCVAGSVDR